MTRDGRRNVVLLGATGSIGGTALRVLRQHPDRLRLAGVAARTNHAALGAICREFDVPRAVLAEESALQAARAEDSFPPHTQAECGEDALEALAACAGADIVLVAVVGARGLRPALAAIGAGHDIALANKELLVLGGAFVMDAARRHNVRLLPTDSEHNAIFQCLQGHEAQHVDKLILTASGGQFRDDPPERLASVTPEDATRHPNWSMGPKITVDSATMANKGLELIEAHWLFGVSPERLEVVLHPQSIVHSLVRFVDGCLLAQLSPPTMSFAVQHCLLFPDRAPGPDATTDFAEPLQLDFRPPDPSRYPCLGLAREALRSGGAAPAIFNAANEIAVERFLANAIGFLDIPKVIEHTLARCDAAPAATVDALFAADAEARRIAGEAAESA